jgi:hypothetical protein
MILFETKIMLAFEPDRDEAVHSQYCDPSAILVLQNLIIPEEITYYLVCML